MCTKYCICLILCPFRLFFVFYLLHAPFKIKVENHTLLEMVVTKLQFYLKHLKRMFKNHLNTLAHALQFDNCGNIFVWTYMCMTHSNKVHNVTCTVAATHSIIKVGICSTHTHTQTQSYKHYIISLSMNAYDLTVTQPMSIAS